MRGALMLIVLCGVVVPAGAEPEPSGGEIAASQERRERAAEQVANHQQAIELTEQATAAAQSGDCDGAKALGELVRDLDAGYYRAVFATTAAITQCHPAVLAPPGLVKPAEPRSAAADRNGLMGGLGLAAGPPGILVGQAWLGWNFSGRVALFATAGLVAGHDDGDGGITGFSFRGIGARLWANRWFFDARFGEVRIVHVCDSDNPCPPDQDEPLALVGLGYEVVQGRHAALDLHGELLATSAAAAVVFGLNVSFYQ